MAQEVPGRKNHTPMSMPSIYPPDRGIMPSFTGHIPGLCQRLATHQTPEIMLIKVT